MEFIKENWPLIVMGLTVLASVLNAATRHFSDQKGLAKALSFISEMLSIIVSANSPGKLKLPLQSVEPAKQNEVIKKKNTHYPFIILLAASLSISACSGWQKNTATSLNATKISLDSLAETSARIWHKRCLESTDEKELADCQGKRKAFNRGLVVAYLSLGVARGSFIVAVATDSEESKKKLSRAVATALREAKEMIDIAKRLGVAP
ncbi:MAG: hypothetical protein QNJ16_18300 [Rhodobacter sp.]|nr:hypothetical protein [Rhodobacter sp.]